MKRLLLIGIVAFMLIACGGGGSGGTPASAPAEGKLPVIQPGPSDCPEFVIGVSKLNEACIQ